jgi:hypothetical protein
MSIEEHAQIHLYKEIEVVQKNDELNKYPELSVAEKAIIYKYSEDSYADLNERLRTDKPITEFGTFLNETLEKLPNYEGLVFKGVNLSPSQIEVYTNAYEHDTAVVEKAFVSTSIKKSIAYQFGKCLFAIDSIKGKDISSFTKHKEFEVLFKNNSAFEVLDYEFDEPNDKHYFKLLEI